MTQGLKFAVLGPVRAWRNGSAVGLGSPQQRTALAILLLARGRMVSTDEMAAALWGLDVPRAARGTIRTYVHRLRRALEEEQGEQVVHSTTGGYALQVPPQTLDLGRFREHVRAAEQAKVSGDREGAATHLHQALAEWQGEPMSDLTSEFAESERGRLGQRRLAVLEELAALELDLGRSPDLLDPLAMAAAAEPLRERLHELLMLCLCRAGRQAEALAVYDRLRRQLGDQLGVDPAPAMRELYQRILEGDPVLLAPPPPAAPPEPAAAPALIPAQLPVDLPVFTGREEELDRLINAVRPDATDAPGVVIVHGMPGLGKTTFAVRAAHRLAPHFPDGQLYLDLRGFEDGDTEVDPMEALWFLLDSLGVPTQQLPSRLDTLTALYRSVLADRGCLILLDNARDTRQVLPLLPGSSRSLAIITSRGNLSGLVAGTGAHTVPLELLSDTEATSFLSRRLGEPRVAAEPEAVRQIVRTCARLPLALALVAARAASYPSFRLADLAAELDATDGGLDAFAGPDSRSDIRSILSWSYRALSPEAARMFRLLSWFPGQVMEVRIGATLAALPIPKAHALFRELAAAHLVEEIRPGGYTWHELLRAYAAELMAEIDGPEELLAVRGRGAQTALHTAYNAARQLSVHPDTAQLGEPAPFVYPRKFIGHNDAFAWFANHHSVLMTMVERGISLGEARAACSLAWSMRHYLDWAGHWRDLEHVNRIALQAAQRIGDRAAAGYAHRGLARVDCHHYRFEQANAHLDEALDCFAEDTLARAYTLRQYLGVRQLEGDYAGALVQATTAIDLFRQADCAIGEHGAQLGVAYNQIRLGRVEEGLTTALDALEVLENAGELYGLSSALDTVAGAYQRLGQYQAAAEYRRRHVAFNRELGHGSDLVSSLLHRNVTSGLINLAELHHTMGEQAEADAELREAMTRLSRELAESYLAISRYDEAKATLRATLANLDDFLAEPDGADWYPRAMKVLQKTAAIAEELGVGAYILDN
ncbi:BTAD domain-containing putative transcriptional regulator [Crossiella sp. CA198]|uniref:AfsR/SARP family transcriptional regulator n=1 Tax=Crossiella sp. CA198 TaxID=3455607 RepID=UPI003F8D0403